MECRVLTPHEWMIRCLLVHFSVQNRVEVFIIAQRRQKTPACEAAARFDYLVYEDGGKLPPCVETEFLIAFPWNRSEESGQSLLAAE